MQQMARQYDIASTGILNMGGMILSEISEVMKKGNIFSTKGTVKCRPT